MQRPEPSFLLFTTMITSVTSLPMHAQIPSWQCQFFDFIDDEGKAPAAPLPFPHRGIVGRTPLGYRTIRSGSTFSVQPESEVAPHVTEIFRRLALPGALPRDVWKQVTSRGLRGATGKPLLYQPFHHTVVSPFYLGLIQHRGELYRGSHPPLTDLTTWKAARSNLLAHEERWRKDNANGKTMQSGIADALVSFRKRPPTRSCESTNTKTHA